jgi:formyl-CoA transferase
MGADVLKIEAPDGDMLRRYPSTLPGESRAFLGDQPQQARPRRRSEASDGRAAIHRLSATPTCWWKT